MTQPTDNAAQDRGPHLVVFDVHSRREATRRLAAADPGARACGRRSWTSPPRLLPGRVGVWCWRGGEAELRACAGDVLLRLVHPLVAGGLPYCVGFPFEEALFAPRPLAVDDADQLDFEDIGALLRAALRSDPRAAAPRCPRSRAGPHRRRPAAGVRRGLPRRGSRRSRAGRRPPAGGRDAAVRRRRTHAARLRRPASTTRRPCRVTTVAVRSRSAGDVLLRLVHPLVAGGLPYC